MKKTKFASKTLVFLMGLPAILFATPFLLSFFLKSELRKVGILDTHFQPYFSALESFALGNVKFRYPFETGELIVEIRELVPGFSLSSLQEGRLTRLLANDGRIIWTQKSSPSEDSGKLGKIWSFSSESLRGVLRSLPFDELLIDGLYVTLPKSNSLLLSKVHYRAPGTLEVKGELHLQEFTLPIESELSLETGEFHGKAKSDYPKLPLFSLSWRGKIQGEEITSAIEGGIDGREQPIIGSLKYSPSKQQGRFLLSTSAKDLSSLLSVFFSTPTDGSKGIEGSSLQVKLEGTIEQNLFESISFELKADHLDYLGIKMLHPRLTGTVRPPTFRHVIGNLHGEVLDGKIDIEKAEIDLQSKQMELPILIRSIAFEKLLSFYPQEGLSAEGKLDGELTLRIQKDGGLFADGEMRSQSDGGVIRFQSNSQNAGSSPLNFATEALEDFHFSKLQAPFTLDPQGELRIQLFLSGNNPSWQKGRMVEFHINLDQNLYSLLRSIRLSRGDLSAIR